MELALTPAKPVMLSPSFKGARVGVRTISRPIPCRWILATRRAQVSVRSVVVLLRKVFLAT